MPSLSVIIITRNEEKNIGRCIDSVRPVADEVLVLDSMSTDRTVDIAAALGARCYRRAFTGYGEQKNTAMYLSTNRHVLFLDADEYLSPELRDSIRREKERGFPSDGYSMKRLSRYCGRWIRHSGWYPDRKLRLLRRGNGAWTNDLVHERLEPKPHALIGALRGDLLHIPYADQEDHVAKIDRYSTLAAMQMQRDGRKPSLLKLLFSPLCSFISGYILHAGFLDGLPGLLIATHSAHYTYLKYLKRWQFARRPGGISSTTEPLLTPRITPADSSPALPSSTGSPQKRENADAAL